MDVIKDMALEFARRFKFYSLSLEKFNTEIDYKLISIYKKSEKVRFLSYLRDFISSEYQTIIKVLMSMNRGTQDNDYEIALYAINQQLEQYNEMEGLSLSEKPAMQFFAEGSYFDAYTALLEIIKQTQSSIVLIDNYVNVDTLSLIPAKEPSIEFKILTKRKCLNEHFKHSIKVYNKQYLNLKVGVSENYHDRFLIIDGKSFFHIGASIKDAGNKTFMFSKIEDTEIHEIILKKVALEWKEEDI